MQGLLADVNVQGHLAYLYRLFQVLGLWTLLVEFPLRFATFRDLQLAPDLDDRALWNFCQQNGWVLLTENRNDDGPDSLQATIADSWQMGHLPILTLANKGHFEHDGAYARQVANDVAELLFDIANGRHRDQSPIFVPR